MMLLRVARLHGWSGCVWRRALATAAGPGGGTGTEFSAAGVEQLQALIGEEKRHAANKGAFSGMRMRDSDQTDAAAAMEEEEDMLYRLVGEPVDDEVADADWWVRMLRGEARRGSLYGLNARFADLGKYGVRTTPEAWTQLVRGNALLGYMDNALTTLLAAHKRGLPTEVEAWDHVFHGCARNMELQHNHMRSDTLPQVPCEPWAGWDTELADTLALDELEQEDGNRARFSALPAPDTGASSFDRMVRQLAHMPSHEAAAVEHAPFWQQLLHVLATYAQEDAVGAVQGALEDMPSAETVAAVRDSRAFRFCDVLLQAQQNKVEEAHGLLTDMLAQGEAVYHSPDTDAPHDEMFLAPDPLFSRQVPAHVWRAIVARYCRVDRPLEAEAVIDHLFAHGWCVDRHCWTLLRMSLAEHGALPELDRVTRKWKLVRKLHLEKPVFSRISEEYGRDLLRTVHFSGMFQGVSTPGPAERQRRRHSRRLDTATVTPASGAGDY